MSFCIGILGDVMLDVEHLVTTSRYAPEDPTIPVYRIHLTENRLGGAANVAKNLARLGCVVEMISVIGADARGEVLRDMLIRDHIDCRLWVEEGRPTTTKTRLYDQETQKLLHRHDEETSEDISMSLEEEMLKYIQKKMASWDAMVISDYNKGLITDRLCRLIKMANQHQRHLPTFIDPKKGFLKYKGCFCIKPNLLEAQIMTGKTADYDVYYDDKSFHIDTILPVPPLSITKTQKLSCEIVEKGWGKEIIFVNNDEYCGKILCFDK